MNPKPYEDRRVHAENKICQIVRYDRAGKWYVEYPYKSLIPSRQINIHEAVSEAYDIFCKGGKVYLQLSGGKTFDRLYKEYLNAN